MSPTPFLSHAGPVDEAFSTLRCALIAEVAAVRPITSSDSTVIDWMLDRQHETASQMLAALRSADPQVREAALARLEVRP